MTAANDLSQRYDRRRIRDAVVGRLVLLAITIASLLGVGCIDVGEGGKGSEVGGKDRTGPQTVVKSNDPAKWIKNLDANEVTKQLVELAGDAKQGKSQFISATCITCHLGVPVEDPIAPSLMGIANRQTREQLVESILHPSQKIVEGYVATKLALFDGKVVSGVLVEETDDVVRLRMTTGQIEAFAVADIEARMKDDVSPMPAGLLGTLTVEQAADLLAYVESL